MKYLVAYSADRGGSEALALGTLLSQRNKAKMVVCLILPNTWGYPSMARVDAEYAAFLDKHAQKAMDKAKAIVGNKLPAQFITRSYTSAQEGLLATADDLGADMIVLGSSRGATAGKFLEGSVTRNLLHASKLPVALAPRGFSLGDKTVLTRVTCAYGATRKSKATVDYCLGFSRKYQVPLRLATFVVRDKQMYPTGAGYQIENVVANQWRSQAIAAQKAMLAELENPAPVKTVIGDGANWKDTLQSIGWKPGEVLVIGSGRLGPLAQVFLGSNGNRIIRNAPVPMIVVPRHAHVDFSDEADADSERAAS
jgi:nucleotide-binding universal stress UspA family protein